MRIKLGHVWFDIETICVLFVFLIEQKQSAMNEYEMDNNSRRCKKSENNVNNYNISNLSDNTKNKNNNKRKNRIIKTRVEEPYRVGKLLLDEMKVVELRNELKKRNLAVFGIKKVLKQRLRNDLKRERMEKMEITETSLGETNNETQIENEMCSNVCFAFVLGFFVHLN